MPQEFRFNFPLVNGLHARPASHFEAAAGRYKATVTLTNERSDVTANVRSVLSMVAADVRHDDPCKLTAAGPDEKAAIEALSAFVRDVLPAVDEVLPTTPEATDVPLPRSLVAAGVAGAIRGRPVVGGIGRGKVCVAAGLELPPGLEKEIAEDPLAERAKAADAVGNVTAVIESRVRASSHGPEVEVLKAHLSIVNDVSLAQQIYDGIEKQNRTAAQAIVAAGEYFAAKLRESESLYLRERVLDIKDVCSQLLDAVVGPGKRPKGMRLQGPSVCVADALTPGQFLSLDKAHLRGLVFVQGGTTSHTIILARSMGIPTVVGAAEATTRLRAGKQVVVDGSVGLVVQDPSPAVQRYYNFEESKLARQRAKTDRYRTADARTADGRRIEVAANVACAEEVAPAMTGGAEGVGLFRTEMLFLDRAAAPTEHEQTAIYAEAIKAAAGRAVIIRLIDIGGDKPAPYLDLPAEENPFLGYRGVRMYRQFSAVVKSQLKAILRASSAGPVKIMIPMVAVPDEVRFVRSLLVEAAGELGVTELPPLGIMVEVPSAAMSVAALAKEAEFLSIGSNDLTQYFLAADRGNAGVSSLYTWAHPPFLRLLKQVAEDARAAGRWVGLCGEMGDDPRALPLLVGLGLDEISLSAPRVSAVKAAVAALSYSQCRSLLDECIDLPDRAAVDDRLGRSSSSSAPMLTAELLPRLTGTTKAEVIKELCDAVQLAGRVEHSYKLEEAVWAREDTYSTGFGYGFAVPHCKSDLLRANTIAVGRLDKGVDWGSLDEKPVDVVILLAVRAADHGKEHMRIFSKLSRLVMRDEFRDRVRSEPDPASLLNFIEDELGLNPVPVGE